MNEAIVHRCRFYKTELYSINCLSYNEQLQKVAILRKRIRRTMKVGVDDQIKIEIWSLKNNIAFLEQTIHDDPKDSSQIESLSWSRNGKLYSCGLNSYLNAYDLQNENIAHKICVNSSALWCMNFNNNQDLIAVGTENGHAVLVRVFEDSFQFEALLNNFSKRILCIEWFYPENGDTKLVGGSIDNIVIWDVKSKNILESIRIGNTNVVVWCIKVLSNFTIIAGDSKGVTSFWNGKLATKNCAFNSHNADVLTISVSDDERMVCSAGVDPKVVLFEKNLNKTGQWLPSTTRKPHTHDIRSLLIIKDSLFLSGGVDSFFSINSFKQHHNYSHLSNFSHKMDIAEARSKKYALVSYEKQLQLYILGTPKQEVHPDGDDLRENSFEVKRLKLNDPNVRLMEIESRTVIITCALNPRFLAYSHYGEIKVYSWDESGLIKVDKPIKSVGAVRKIVITEDDFILACYGKCLDVFKIDEKTILNVMNHRFNGRVHDFAVSTGKTIAVSLDDDDNSLIIQNYDSSEVLKSVNNPVLPSTMKFDKDNKLWLAYPNALIMKFDTEKLEFTENYQLLNMKMNQNQDTKKFNLHWPIKQIAFMKKGLLFSNDNYLCCLNTEKNFVTKADQYRHVLYMNNFNHSDQLTIFEAIEESIFHQLPSSLTGNTFGT